MMPKSPPCCRAGHSTERRGSSSNGGGGAGGVCYAAGLLNDRLRIVTRQILDDSRVHPAIRARIADEGRAVIAEVQAAIAANSVVVVGMAWNPFPRKARKWLDAAGAPYEMIE